MNNTSTNSNKGQEKQVLGVKVNSGLDMGGVMQWVGNLLSDGNCHYITTTNAEFIMEAQKDMPFRAILNEADLSVPDGSGVLMAIDFTDWAEKTPKSSFFIVKALIRGLSVGFRSSTRMTLANKRVAGVELFYEMCSYAEKNNLNVFLLGGWPKDKKGKMLEVDYDLADRTAGKLRLLYPNLHIVGATSAFNPFESNDSQTVDYIKYKMKEASVSNIDFLFVAYGHPHQEKWIKRNMCKVPAKVCMGVGGTFDYVIQTQKRSPDFYINHNLEWLYKLVTQPWRLRRIVRAFPSFPILVYLKSVKKS